MRVKRAREIYVALLIAAASSCVGSSVALLIAAASSCVGSSAALLIACARLSATAKQLEWEHDNHEHQLDEIKEIPAELRGHVQKAHDLPDNA